MKSYQFLKRTTLAGLALLIHAGTVFASGEPVNVGIGAIPAGKSITITYDVTVNRNLPLTTTEVSQQGTVSGSNFADVLTDDPDTIVALDPTVTFIDSIAPVAGFGSAADFNGTDAFFEVVDGDALDASAYTIEAWVRPRTVGPATLLSRTDAALTGIAQALYLDVAGHFVHQANDGSVHEVVGTTVVMPNRWYHVAGVLDAGTLRLYVDGSEEGTAVAGLGAIADSDRYRAGFGIVGAGGTSFDGQLDELRIWSGGLSSAQLAAWMYRGADVTHPAIGQLVASYRFDEAAGLVAVDAVGTLDGTLTTSLPSPRAASTVNEWHTADTAPVAGRFVLSDSDGTSSDGLNLAPNLVCTITGYTLGSATNADCSGFTFTPTLNANGAGTVTYRISDGSLNSNNYTATIHITDTTAPTAAISYSPAGPYVKGNVVTITADFSEPIADSPAMQLVIDAITGGGGLPATAMTRVSDTRYTYEYTVGNGHGTANVALATGQDLVGNVVTATPISGGSFTVQRTATTTALTSSANPATYGDALSLTATVTSGATGTMTFRNGATAVPNCIDLPVDGSGQATCAPAALAAATHAFTATYNGDDTYAASTSALVAQVVNPAALTVKADGQSKVYGEANPDFTASYSGFVLGQDPSVLGGTLVFITPATQSSDVGSYAITPAGLTSGNYAITFVDGSLTVNPASLTVTADDQTRSYGEANPVLTASYGGFVLGQDPSVLGGALSLSTDADQSSVPASYAITPAGLTSDNYAITFVPGTLKVNAALLTVTADDQSKVYGEVNPTFTARYDGFVLGQDTAALGGALSLTTTADQGSGAGVYAITPAGLTSGNYAITFIDGTLTVAMKSLEVTALPARKLAGSADPEFAYTYAGFVNGDTATLFTGALGRDAGEADGVYAIKLGTLSAGANYAIAFTGDYLTIYSHVISSLVVSPDNPQNLTAGLVDTGIMRSIDGGATWTQASGQPASGPIRALVMHPLTHATLYAALYGGGTAISTDGGANWDGCANAGLSSLDIVSLAIDPAGTLYAGTGTGVFTSIDCAAWTTASTGLPAVPVNALLIDPTSPATLYAGLDGAGVYRSTDSGGNWAAATTQPGNRPIRALATQNGSTLYAATYGGGVFVSSDGGNNWAGCATQPADLALHSLLLAADGKLYAGSEAGVFVSSDGCATWTALNAGLP